MLFDAQAREAHEMDDSTACGKFWHKEMVFSEGEQLQV
jgi:hypothetical protein